MEKIIELSQLVTGFITPDNARALFKENNKDSKSYILFDGILRKRFHCDKDAAKEIYNCPPTDKRFQMLKSRTKSKLMQLVFTMDLNNKVKSTYAKAWYRSHKNIYVSHQLIQLGYRSIIADKLKETYTEAEKYQFTDIQLTAARIIRDHEAFTGNIKKINKWNQVIKELKEILDVELESEQYFQTIRIFFRQSVSHNKTELKLAEDCFAGIDSLMKKSKKPSNLSIINSYRISIYYYHLMNNHVMSLNTCNKFEDYLKKNPKFIITNLLAEVNMQKLDTALYLKNYKVGRASAENCLKYISKSEQNWLIANEAYFLLCLHTQMYKEAYDILIEIKSHKHFSNFPPERIERWKIFEAFISYILPTDRRKKQFNVHKFVNEVPVFSRDKIGYNLSIIVAQVMLLVKEGDYDRVMDKYDSLKAYARRHIHKDRSPRSYYFVKMLLTMIKYDFDPEKTEAIAAKFFDKLCAARIGNQGELETLEVIPYDVLWKDLLEKLKMHKEERILV